MNLKFAVVLILNSLFTVFGQMLLKTGMDKEQVLSFRVLINPRILSGLFIYGIATIVWLYILPRVTFSIAYPINSVAYIFSIFLSFFILGEAITVSKVLGSIIIIIGIILVFH